MLQRLLSSLALTLASGALLALPAGAITSTFDSGLEGWTAIGLEPMFTLFPPALNDIVVTDNSADMEWSGTDGNPGGYAAFVDEVNDPSALASAPAAFLGDLTSFIGGTFSFQHRLEEPGASASGFAPYTLIIGSGEPENLDALVWVGDAPTGMTGWEQFDITLDVTNDSTGLTFIEDVNLSAIDPDFPNVTLSNPLIGLGGTLSFIEIMANVDFIWLAFELVDNANDQREEMGGIDNVSITPIPEPGTAALLCLGLVALARSARRT